MRKGGREGGIELGSGLVTTNGPRQTSQPWAGHKFTPASAGNLKNTPKLLLS